MVNIISSSRYKIAREQIKELGYRLLSESGFTQDCILNIIFIGKIKMKAIAAKYKKENVALPVLSFPYNMSPSDEGQMLGEIFICYPQAVLLAAEREKKVSAMLEELIRHGIQNLLK